MGLYSGFSTRRQEERYNQLTRQLLHLLGQMVVTCVESSRLSSFKPGYEKILLEVAKMDEHKFSELKVSLELELLTQHILGQDLFLDSFEEKQKKTEKHHFRLKRTLHDGARTIESANPRGRAERGRGERRSLSMSGDKRAGRQAGDERAGRQAVDEGVRDFTMEQLMRMHPLIEKKMTHIRKKRYLRAETNNFPQIQEVEEETEERQ